MAAKNIKAFIDLEQPKAKLNYLVSCYLTANASQNFIDVNSVSLKKTIGKVSKNNPDELIELIKEDLISLIYPYFNNVDIDITVKELEDRYVLLMDISADKVSLHNSYDLKSMASLSDGIVIETYGKMP